MREAFVTAAKDMRIARDRGIDAVLAMSSIIARLPEEHRAGIMAAILDQYTKPQWFRTLDS